MAPQGTRRRNRQKLRRHELRDAARELFIDRGYRGTTMEQVARHAGYSKRTVYLDYRSKDEIFIDVCLEGGELLLEKLSDARGNGISVEEGIDRLLDVYIAFSRDHREYFRMIFSEATPEIIAQCTPELRDRVAELERSCLQVVVDLVDRAVREGIIPDTDPWAVAGIFLGTATGIILLSMGGSQSVFSKETLESLVKNAIWTLWRGLGIRDADSKAERSQS